MGKKRDWKRAADYEDLRKLTPIRWAWEFLRRNPSYIREWEKDLPLELERRKKLLSNPISKGVHKDAPSITLNTERQNFAIHAGSLNKYFKKWGILNLVNPEQDAPFPSPFHQFTSFDHGTVRGGNMGWGKFPFGTSRYVPAVFDITRPLKPQFTNAQKVLLDWQKDQAEQGNIRITAVKKHKDNWVEYLRILDAKTEKVKNNEIARAMFPNLSNEYPDYQGNQKVRKSLKAAKALTENGYREIAMTF